MFPLLNRQQSFFEIPASVVRDFFNLLGSVHLLVVKCWYCRAPFKQYDTKRNGLV